MPTGGGKSLCYQVPALSEKGLCLVISPLIALMKDQVENLRKKNITAFAIYSGMSRRDIINILKVATNSNCKFLYVSPERLETSLFKEYLPGMNVNLIAVDEAHCISQWGYDFRPPYLRIATLREELPGVPVLALTASATPEVQKDICQKLNFSDENILRQSFERPDLSYSVFNVDSKINKIHEILKNVPGSGIIYCKSRKRTREISDLLQLQQISCDHYHAGLTQDERNRKQEAWITNRIRVIICTNAFGMGIDKPDVRTVIHADVPDSLENYYQEAGRAGRDGKRSYAVLLFDNSDIGDLQGQSGVRYPSPAEIRNVYQSICNYLQLAAGAGGQQSFDFNLGEFAKKFELDTYSVIYGIKSLEQEGWLTYNEQVFMSSTIQFTTNKETLYEFERSNPSLEPLIKALLRAYEGIFDFNVPINETVISKLLAREIQAIKKELLQLHIMGMIDYRHHKDAPQLYFLHDRVKAEDLSINMELYTSRKKRFEERVNKMIGYVKEETLCRAQYIGSYFGDKKVSACGFCDTCLRKKPSSITKDEFERITKQIHKALESRKTLLSNQLLEQLGGIKKEKALKVIEFLQSENKIEVDRIGRIRLTGR